jgi:mannose-6-phosphate isomerase-like protein (cupin superfamily)
MIIKNQKNSEKITGNEGAIIYDLLNPQHVENRIRYSLAYVNLPRGKSTLPHIMKTSEVYYILEGKGVLYINNESDSVEAGDTIFVSSGSKQYVENIDSGDLKFLCIVDPAWKKDNETIL